MVPRSTPKGSFFLWTFQSEPSPCINLRTQFSGAGEVESTGCISAHPLAPPSAPLPTSASWSLVWPVQAHTTDVAGHHTLLILTVPKYFSQAETETSLFIECTQSSHSSLSISPTLLLVNTFCRPPVSLGQGLNLAPGELGKAKIGEKRA